MTKEKLDVFWASAPHSDIRKQLAATTLGWWTEYAKNGTIRFHKLNPSICRCTATEFNRERRIYAENHAKSAIYLLIDDDCLPLTKDFVNIGVRDLTEHDEFAIISGFPANCTISRWTPENYVPHEDLHVMEVHDIGGARFMRKGAMKEWPEANGRGYDAIQCQWLRKLGWRVGYSQFARYNHLGEGRSDIWNSLEAEKQSWEGYV